MKRRWMVGAALSLTMACDRGQADPAPAADGPCRVLVSRSDLPAEVHETSGLAIGRGDPSLLWTHNDSGNEAVLFALDTTGALLGRVEVTGASLVDWEDLEAGPCDDGTCLFIADIGDNRGLRDSVTIYAVPEPEPGAERTARATAFHARYPGGAQDAESMFILPNGDLYLVTKGRQQDVALYRYPRAARRAGETFTLERVRGLLPRARRASDMVTAATASPDGRWVAIRSYRTLYLYSAAALTGADAVTPVATVDLRPLRERQGESIALTDSMGIWLTSEGGRGRDRPTMARLACARALGR